VDDMSYESSVAQPTIDLLAAARGGDRQAMSRLIEAELPWVRAVVAGYVQTPENIDDICQEIFIAVWQCLGHLRSVEGFKAWLYRIAVNKVRSHFRGAARRPAAELSADIASTDGRAEAERDSRREAVLAALKKIAPGYRDPLVMHYLHGKSCDETADILGLRPVTCRIRLMRGRQQLEELLRKEGVL
jgi:RNA polymerase sigma-70 factor, ECF subfamily